MRYASLDRTGGRYIDLSDNESEAVLQAGAAAAEAATGVVGTVAVGAVLLGLLSSSSTSEKENAPGVPFNVKEGRGPEPFSIPIGFMAAYEEWVSRESRLHYGLLLENEIPFTVKRQVVRIPTVEILQLDIDLCEKCPRPCKENPEGYCFTIQLRDGRWIHHALCRRPRLHLVTAHGVEIIRLPHWTWRVVRDKKGTEQLRWTYHNGDGFIKLRGVRPSTEFTYRPWLNQVRAMYNGVPLPTDTRDIDDAPILSKPSKQEATPALIDDWRFALLCATLAITFALVVIRFILIDTNPQRVEAPQATPTARP